MSRITRLSLVFTLMSLWSFSQRPIDTSEIFTIGGIRQHIHLKGADDSKPILLFLHGGPGSSLMQKTDRIAGKLQQHFVVVQWDQRETGESLRLNKTPVPLTLDMFYNDTRDIIDTLLRKYNRSKLYLAGYSWGSGLGFHIAGKYPEQLYAYIAISPVIDQARADSLSLAMLREKMGKQARKDLSIVKIPFENWEHLYYHRKWLLKYDGQKLVSLALRKSFVQGWAATWFDVWSQSCDVNLFKSLPTINCPVYFFAGDRDYNTHHAITSEYFSKVKAPKKDLFLLEHVGHALPETHPDWFQEIIIKEILPATFTRIKNERDGAE